MGAQRRRGGGLQKWASVLGPLFCVRTDVAAKGAGTQILARKSFFHQTFPPHISLGRYRSCQHGAFSGVGSIVASFVSTECPKGRGMWGIFGKPLKRAIWNTPGLHAVLTTCVRFLSVSDDVCAACCPLLLTGTHHVCLQISRNVLLPPPMHYRNLWCGKELALGVSGGCRCMSLAAGQKSLVQPVHSNLHVTTRNTRFYPLLRPLLLQRNFGIKRRIPPRLHNMQFQTISMVMSAQMGSQPCLKKTTQMMIRNKRVSHIQ